MELIIPEKVAVILHTLGDAGYEAFAVGGCVRDAILNRRPEDWDITTLASPEQVKELFPRCIDTGIQHGTVTVMMGKDGFEVTTYRIDGEYHDGRHPDSVAYTSDLREDLRRRDFTMNAMAYHPKTGLVDIFGGREDLAAGIVRCVGDARERFTEDALRILRAVRFSAQLDFTIEEQTLEALQELAPRLSLVSRERIQVELTKLLVSKHPDRVKLLYDTGILTVILPELAEVYREYQEELLLALQHISAGKWRRYAALLAECGQSGAKKVLKSLKFDTDTMQNVSRLVGWKDRELDGTIYGVRKLMHETGEVLFLPLMELKEALLQADLQSDDAERVQAAKAAREQIKLARLQFEEVLERGQCTSLAGLAVSGADLLAAGFPQGRLLGQILNGLLEEVLEHPEYNEKALLLQKAEAFREEH